MQPTQITARTLAPSGELTGVREQTDDRCRKCVGVAWRHQDAGLPMVETFRNTVDVGRNDCASGFARFADHQWHWILAGREYKHISLCKQRCGLATKTQEMDAIGVLGRPRLRFEFGAI